MFVDPKRYKRAELSEEQFEFLARLMPFARLIQEMSVEKCRFVRLPTTMGLAASIAMADIILKSDWGRHAAARKENNLGLLKKTEYWKGRSAEIGGVCYRSYSSWLDFSIDLTDELTFYERRKYESLLLATNLDEQLDRFQILFPSTTTSDGRIEDVIERYGLLEFDY